MKKSSKTKQVSTPKKASSDIPGFMANIQNQLSNLARKLDALLGGAPPKAVESQTAPEGAPAHSEKSQRPDGPRHHHPRGDRPLYKAVCADCQKDCEIPFKPSGDRPVYCKECFGARKAARRSAGKPPSENRQERVPHHQPLNVKAATVPGPKVFVTKKGVGRVTVTEVSRHSTNSAHPRPKSRQPARGPREIPGRKKH